MDYLTNPSDSATHSDVLLRQIWLVANSPRNPPNFLTLSSTLLNMKHILQHFVTSRYSCWSSLGTFSEGISMAGHVLDGPPRIETQHLVTILPNNTCYVTPCFLTSLSVISYSLTRRSHAPAATFYPRRSTGPCTIFGACAA